ncbi:multidrug transporter [Streptococcus ictaluri]|uniref:Uncharacterized protein n=1 Tax=Streptococcus ictaluri 707-05 TaxID=764299 RepID=G5K3E7_9STRE|nr:hypothetical protein [Streptococcus ictaluri]EHI69602.1 hypothetical protein STRIC_1316 [Streptococcus ictaluri 707-05]
MTKLIKILAITGQTPQEENAFFKLIANNSKDFFDITIISKNDPINFKPYEAVFAFDTIESSLPLLLFAKHISFQKETLTEILQKKPTLLLEIGKVVTNFYYALKGNFLEHLPLQARLSDQNGNIIYNNHKFNGSFFADQETKLEEWLLHELKANAYHQKYYFIPSASLDHIYIQHYQALYDASGNFIGIYDNVQDFKPILSQYLEETGQAIVGWSDVTSGPSISDSF